MESTDDEHSQSSPEPVFDSGPIIITHPVALSGLAASARRMRPLELGTRLFHFGYIVNNNTTSLPLLRQFFARHANLADLVQRLTLSGTPTLARQKISLPDVTSVLRPARNATGLCVRNFVWQHFPRAASEDIIYNLHHISIEQCCAEPGDSPLSLLTLAARWESVALRYLDNASYIGFAPPANFPSIENLFISLLPSTSSAPVTPLPPDARPVIRNVTHLTFDTVYDVHATAVRMILEGVASQLRSLTITFSSNRFSTLPPRNVSLTARLIFTQTRIPGV